MQTHVPAQADQAKQQQAKTVQQPTQLVGEQQGAFVDNRREMAEGLQLRQLMDNSPQAVEGRALQAMMNNSAQAREGRALQAMINNSPLVREEQAFQLMLNSSARANPPVQRVEEEETLQAKATNENTAQLETAAEAPKPNNTGLPDNLKSGIESLSGMSMDHVKVHYNSSQPAQLNAHAYAQGSEIHVAPGQEQHVPHEAWHVVQQAQGRVKPTVQMKGGVPVNDDVGLESEADVMGAKALGALQMQRFDSVGILEPTPSSLQLYDKQHVLGGGQVAQAMNVRTTFTAASVSGTTQDKHVVADANQAAEAQGNYGSSTFVRSDAILTAAVDADAYNFPELATVRSARYNFNANVVIDQWDKSNQPPGGFAIGQPVSKTIDNTSTNCEIGVVKGGDDQIKVTHFKKI